MQRETVYADLHTHTTCSDGALTPEALVERAAERGVQVLSVTDHDSLAGLESARTAALRWGLRVVTGVELSVTMKGEEVHLLAYGIDPSHETLRRHLRQMVQARRDRVRRMVAQLQDMGLDLPDEALEAALSTEDSVGRPHVASALVRSGHVDTIGQAFDKYLAQGQPAFVAKPEVPGPKVVSLIHDAGGVAVLAHPGHWTPSRRIRNLVEAGLDGIETIHPSHDPTLRRYYEQWARGSNLLETGGSDYHGTSGEGTDSLGTVGMSKSQWERFRDAVS